MKAQVFQWAVSSECPKIVTEVRLIVVVRLVSYQRPIGRLRGINCMENVLQSIEACQYIRRDANYPFELSEQVVLADANMVTQRSD
jgi:hypothetical protein